jgi:uncharacterized protein (TIGR02996 family)
MTAVESTRAALLAAVLAAPDDDAVRLVFADWLEEHGEEERAEFVRLQCRLAEIEREIGRRQFFHGLLLERDRLCGREVELLPGQRKLADAALTAVLGGGFAFNLGRGFVHSVTLPAADWLKHAKALLEAHPIREVRFSTWPCARSRVAVGSQPFGEFWTLHPGWSVEEPQVITMHHDRGMLVRGVLKKRWPLITFTLPS